MSVSIEDQVALLEDQLTEHEQRIPRDQVKIDSLSARIAELKGELRSQAEQKQKIEEVIEEGEIAFNIPGVDFKQLPAEVIQLIEKIVRVDRRSCLAEVEKDMETIRVEYRAKLTASEERESQLNRRVGELEDIIDTGKAANASLTHDNGSLRDRISELISENEDLHSKLANASAQLEEKDQEIERLNSEIQDHRAAKVFGERQAQKIIDVTPDETSEMQALVSKIVSVNHYRGNFYDVVLEDGTKQTLHKDQLGEVEKKENSFRGQGEGNNQADSSNDQLPASQTAQGVTFPTFTQLPQTPAIGLAEGDVRGEVAEQDAGPVTRQEFEELKQRVAILEMPLGSVAV